jgi:HAD superfamily phosphoserine phosphatase-like hydrolase
LKIDESRDFEKFRLTMNLVVLTDFDGTVTLNDTFEDVLERFGTGDWKAADDLYVRGEISLEECVRLQGAMVRVPAAEILSYLDGKTKFRANFDKLVGFCEIYNAPLVIVSAGLDFVIKHFLAHEKFQDKVKLCGASARSASRGLTFEWPALKSNRSINFKDDTVRYYKQKAEIVAYIGDGRRDIHALRNADRRFVIRNSNLARLCKEQEIQASLISDFDEVVNSLRREILLRG